MLSRSFPAGRPRSSRASRLGPAVLVACFASFGIDLIAPRALLGQQEIKVRHVLVRKRSEAEAALDDLVNQGVSRENFIRVARKHSMDAVTKGAGGDLGWNTRGKFVPEFADAAFELKAGEVSEPVFSPYGWHLIFVEEKRETGQRNVVREPPQSVFTEGAENDAGSDEAASGAQDVGEESDDGTGTPAAGVDSVPPVPVGGEPPRAEATRTPASDITVSPRVFIPEKKLVVTLAVDRLKVTPTQGIEISLLLENQGKSDLKVFHPQLLPLGLSVRSDTAPAEPPLNLDAVEAPPSFLVDLPSRSYSGRIAVLHDYFKDLPSNNRFWLSFSAEKFLSRFEERFPGESARIADFEAARAALTANRSEFLTEVDGVFETLNRPGTARSISEAPVAIFESLIQNRKYYARIDLTGESQPMWFELFNDRQNAGVRRFAELALTGYYDGLSFFDVQKGRYARGGCPRNQGDGGPTQFRRVENTADLTHERGTLSLVTKSTRAGAGREAGSVFFISLGDNSQWDSEHVPIGRLVDGEAQLERLEASRRTVMQTVTIVPESRAPAAITGAPPSAAPAASSGAEEPRMITGRELPELLIQTSKGDLKVELFQDDARNTVANFVTLVEEGFYNPDPQADKAPLEILERVDGYYVRTGSPDNANAGGPGYRINNEVINNTKVHERGTLSMCLEVSANGQPVPNTAGSQFFICLDDVAYWNGLYTPFGRVTEGLDVLAQLKPGDTIQSTKVLAKRQGQQLYQPTTNPPRKPE